MKKIILSFAFICILALSVQAQGLYLGAGIGYGFRAGSVVVGSNDHSDGSSAIVKGSYGMGLVPNLSAGYMFTSSTGVELAIGELIGTRTMTTDDFGNNTGNSKYSAMSFYLNPSFVIRANTESKIVPYAKVGVFLGLANSGSDKTYAVHYNGLGNQITSTDDTEVKTKGNVATGLTSAFGLDFMLSDRFAIFGELTGRLASWSPNSYTTSNTHTDYTNGIAQSSSQSSISGNYVNTTPANYTGTNLSSRILPLSAIGFNVGVKLYLGK
jgi:hypothetical protein